ncbi:MAG: hypothetical protein ACRDZ7_14675 [Acidimicrobiia bacterium]
MPRQRRGAGAVAVGALLALVVWSAPVSAGPGDFFPGPGGSSELSVRGAGKSHADGGDYGLGVWASTPGGPEEADGQFRFGHRGPDGEYGMAGNVHCLSRDASGLIQVSGRIFGSGGQNFAGKDFAATIDVDSSPQRFSDVTLGEAGTVGACSGGQPSFHGVTDGGYETEGR